MICTHVISQHSNSVKHCHICAPKYIDKLLAENARLKNQYEESENHLTSSISESNNFLNEIKILERKVKELEKKAIWCGDDRVR